MAQPVYLRQSWLLARSALALSLAACLLGCAHEGSDEPRDHLTERWYRYGQLVAFQATKPIPDKLHDGGYLPPLFFMVLTGDPSAEATLLMSMLLFADSKETGKLMLDRFAEGTKNPADTRTSLFLDPFPKSEENDLSLFHEHHAGKGFRSEEAGRLIQSKLDSSSFVIQAAYAKFYIVRYAGGAEESVAVAKKLDELQLRATSKREKEFWSILQAITKGKKPLSAEGPKSPRGECRNNLETLANANFAYRIKTKSSFTKDVSKLAITLERIPTCPEGGKYSIVVGKPADSFTVHCSLTAHDMGEAGEPDGYSPGVNAG